MTEARPDVLIQAVVRSGDHEPFVQMKWGDASGQLTVEEARQHARHVLECAEAAQHDAAWLRFNVLELGLEEEAAVQILADLRRFRGDSTREDWRGE